MDLTSDQTILGNGSLAIPPIGLGCGPLGGLSTQMDNSQALAVLEAAWNAGIRYFDTAPWYGNTQSEHRLGAFLREKPRNDFAITTKIGRVYKRPDDRVSFENSKWRKRWPGGLPFIPHFDYSYDGVIRSYEDSLARLGVPRIDGLAIHDLDLRHHDTSEDVANGFEQLSKGGGYEALCDLRNQGDIRAIGAGINLPGLIPIFLERFEIDYFILALPYTLLDQSALKVELPLCLERGTSVIIGAPFASGILATGATKGATYAYAPADDEMLERVSAMERIAENHDIPLASAALQFPLAHPAVAAIIPGAETPDQAISNVAAFHKATPGQFWDDVKTIGLLDPDAPVPSV